MQHFCDLSKECWFSFGIRSMKLFNSILCVFILLCWAAVFCKGDGQCIWYGECGFHPDTHRPVNCVYNGTAKPFTNASTLQLYSNLCPDLFQGPNTKTCCSDAQLIRMASNVQVPQQLLSSCPSCWHNFLNIYCYFTCAPDQSNFLYPSVTSPWVDPVTDERQEQVLEINYAVSNTFASGVFQSCMDVEAPGTEGERAIAVLCGHSADQCTPTNWLDYMGTISNGQTPFQIRFNVTDNAYVTARGVHVTPSNPSITPSPCGSPSSEGSDKREIQLFESFPKIQVVVERTGQHSQIVHNFPPPSTNSITFSPLFDKKFLLQVLDMLQRAKNVTPVDDAGATVSLGRLCLRSDLTEDCVVQSVFNYYQDNATRFSRQVTDAWGFFVLADYLDHFLYCRRHPTSTNDTTALHESCLAPFGAPTYPGAVLGGFNGTGSFTEDPILAGCCATASAARRPKYENATKLLITFILKQQQTGSDSSALKHWKAALTSFVQQVNQDQTDMTLTVNTSL